MCLISLHLVSFSASSEWPISPDIVIALRSVSLFVIICALTK
jgi:hypothetical protein